MSPGSRELADEKLSAAAGRREILAGEPAGERETAERADQRPLLVGEVDRLERDRQVEAGVLHGAENLQRADHAERSVVAAAPAHRVEVRAEQERGRDRLAGAEDRRVVCGRVDPELEPRRPRPVVEPRPGGKMGVGEGRPLEPAVRRRPDPGERVEVGAKAVRIDAEIHRRRCYPASRRRHRVVTDTSRFGRQTVAMQDNESRWGDPPLGQLVELKRHQDGVDRHTVTQVVALAETLALEAERLVQGHRRLVPGEDVELELPDTDAAGPCDRLLEQGSRYAPAAMTRSDHQAEVCDMAARRVDVAGQREPRNDTPLVLGHVDGRVGVTTDGPQVAPLVRDAPPLGRGQKPRALLAADLARELDERLRVARFRRANRDHGTTTP